MRIARDVGPGTSCSHRPRQQERHRCGTHCGVVVAQPAIGKACDEQRLTFPSVDFRRTVRSAVVCRLSTRYNQVILSA
jgi:hypothetical protein